VRIIKTNDSEEIILSWEQAEELEDEYWQLCSDERMALSDIVSDISSGIITEQDEYTEAKKVTDALQNRMKEIQNLFENAIVTNAPDDALSSFRRRIKISE